VRAWLRPGGWLELQLRLYLVAGMHIRLHPIPRTDTRENIALHFNLRLMEMSNELGLLLLALDRYRRGLVLGDPATQRMIKVTAAQYWQQCGYSDVDVAQLLREISWYWLFESPYNQDLREPGWEGCVSYWKSLNDASRQLSILAMKLLCMCLTPLRPSARSAPSAADRTPTCAQGSIRRPSTS
jgi:hypothetical protein